MGHDLGTTTSEYVPGRPDRGVGRARVRREFERPDHFRPRRLSRRPERVGRRQPAAIVRIDNPCRYVCELGEESVTRRMPDGCVEVEVPCSNLDAFRSWLFGWGAHAEVVAPADLRRADLIEWLRTMASRS